MPYSIRKTPCKQKSGKKGNYVLSYKDKKGKRQRNCHTSRKKATGQIAAIEMRESYEVDLCDKKQLGLMETFIREFLCL